MIGLGVPWWLIALVAIPLIRWLHRWQAPLFHAPVSAVFLWHSAESQSDAGERLREPDPAWRRRALIAAILILALAQPWWQRDSDTITVWIDDSISMATREKEQTRLADGLDRAAKVLQQASAARVTMRSLSNPAKSVSGDADDVFNAGNWLNASSGEPAPPPAVALNRDAAHWLITDGANERLVKWASAAPLNRIFHAGTATENVAVTKLSARPSSSDQMSFDLLIQISNRGKESATRSLTIASGPTTVETRTLTLQAGENRYVQTSVPRTAGGITARLDTGDALGTDDFLSLAASAIAPLRLSIDPACPLELSLALRLHPSSVVVTANEAADLQVVCSAQPVNAPAVLRFHTSASVPLESPLEWRPGLGRLKEVHLQTQWIATAAWDTDFNQPYESLLAANELPLVIRRPGLPVVVETILDMTQPEFVRQPEYTAVVAALIDLPLGRSSLDIVVTSNRDPAASDITPTRLNVRSDTRQPVGVIRWPLADILLGIAALLLCVDVLMLWQARRKAYRG